MYHKKPLITTFIILLLFSYCTKSEVKTSTSESIKTDSIRKWIKNGRNKENTDQKRLFYIKKAQTTIHNIANDSIKARLLSKLSLAYLRLKKNNRFQEVNKATILLSKKLGDSLTLAESYWDLGEFHTRADSAYYYYSKAHKLYHNLDKKITAARMLYNMAVVQGNMKDYTGSEINTIQALELLKNSDNYKRLYNCYNQLGITSNNLNAYDKAISNYNKALEYAMKLDNRKTLKLSLINNIGFVYLSRKDYVNAVINFRQVVKNDSVKFKDSKLYGKALNNLGYCYLKLNKQDDIPELFFKAEKILDTVHDFQGLALTIRNIAEYYATKKDTLKSMLYIDKSYIISKASADNEGQLNALKLLATVDTKNSARYAKSYIKLKDSLIQEERSARDKFARIRFETNEFIAENETLAKQKQLWTGIAIGLLLLAGAVFIIVNQNAKNQRLIFQQKQQTNNQEIFNLMLSQKQKMQEGKQIEQKRISEELHDGVLGKMLGVRMLLTGLNKRTGDDVIKERTKAISALRDIEIEVRSISHELNDNAYRKINDFINAIEYLLMGFQKSSGINYDFSYDQDIEWDELSGDIKINTYRMIQECMQNSRKHAECTEVFVNFDIYDSNFVIAMGDNGKGFKQDKERKGIGMRNLQSRIKKLDGQLDIESALGKGTKITLTVPLSILNKQKIEHNPHLKIRKNYPIQT